MALKAGTGVYLGLEDVEPGGVDMSAAIGLGAEGVELDNVDLSAAIDRR